MRRSERSACSMNVGVDAVLQVDVDAVEAVALHQPCTLFAKFVAEAELLTEIEPFWPPTERITFWPRECSVAMSALNWASV